MKESKLESNCNKLARLMGWVTYKGLGDVGASDGVYLKDGRGFTCEFKSDKGNQSKVQKLHQKELINARVPYYLIRSVDEFKDVILIEEDKFERK